MDSDSEEHTIYSIAKNRRHKGRFVQYFEDRSKDQLNKKLFKDKSIDKRYNVGALGLRALLVQLNYHESAIASHFAQENGLWDIVPAAVATQFTNAVPLDGNGNSIEYKKYIIIPKGFVIYTGNKFDWVIKELRKPHEPKL